jgi:hypothetical protein
MRHAPKERKRVSVVQAMWRYWFRISRYVYGGNRSFAPILRQRRWSLLYDVY